MKAHLVFVYGTLKKGYYNHYFLKDSKFIDEAITKEKYALYFLKYPYVIKNAKISQIYGEVYEVDDTTLIDLDFLEGHPNFYRRELIPVILLNKNKTVDAWIYFYPEKKGNLIPSGEF